MDTILNSINTRGGVCGKNNTNHPLIVKFIVDAYEDFNNYQYFIFRSMNDIDNGSSNTTQECEALIKYIETKDETLINNIVPHNNKYFNLIVELVKTNFFDNHELEFEIVDTPS